MAKKRKAKRPAACPQTCSLFDTDKAWIPVDLESDTDGIEVVEQSWTPLVLAADTVKLIEPDNVKLFEPDTSPAACPYCGSKPDKT